MSVGMMKMYISFVAIVFMFISVAFIMLSRYKLKNKPMKILLAALAYILMVSAGLIIFFVVFSGPVPE